MGALSWNIPLHTVSLEILILANSRLSLQYGIVRSDMMIKICP
jgi:hypothetical protein